MEGFVFHDADLRQLERLGITLSQVLDQIEILRKSSFYIRLNRPCTLGDGIHKIPEDKAGKYLSLHDTAARKNRFQKFVPASGAATRMFQSLLQIYYVPQFLDCDELYRRVEQGVALATDFLRFVEQLHKFPFWEELEASVARSGLCLNALLQKGQFRTVLDHILTPCGLNYGSLPKGLLKFHRYSDGSRTAFEEHLVEAAYYLKDEVGRCNLHFTVPEEHEEGFRQVLERTRFCYEEHYGACYNVCFSHQKRSTDTIAVDLENRPFRDLSGSLHFRPGGHGALLENLNDLQGDLVYIKNIDNLVPDRLKETSAYWKKILAGYLVEVQQTVHGFLRSLKATVDEDVVERAMRFAKEDLLIHFPVDFSLWPVEKRRWFLFERLNRPIRVCGVVVNTGEPGGAPFWVEDKSGALTLQIVERAQVDFSSPSQQEIWMSSTHFNPVDLVCGLRDFEGKPFDLRRYVDSEAVFISRKFKDGKEIKALELPGLWNGAMADWITIIVEVPEITFNPVKTVYDLLRPEHQP